MLRLDEYLANPNRGYSIAIASDHGGLLLKTHIISLLRSVTTKAHFVIDLGPNTPDRVDYPDYAAKVCGAILDHRAERGILICGSGIGMSMAANRNPGIRCALVSEPYSAQLSRLHNDSNVLALGARLIGQDMASECVTTWLSTPYEGGRHDLRVAKMDQA